MSRKTAYSVTTQIVEKQISSLFDVNVSIWPEKGERKVDEGDLKRE